jgi:LPXTG-motif cell wall-anchored protein
MSRSSLPKLAFWTCALTVLLLSLLPTSPGLPSTGWDKSNHFLGFITLALLGLLAYGASRGKLFIGLLAFGGLIELLQSLTPYRLAEWADLWADGLGVLAGFALFALLRRFRAARARTGDP